jgi:hypothetical protein
MEVDQDEESEARSYYSATDLPGFPILQSNPWCHDPEFPHITSNGKLLNSLMEVQLPPWTEEFQQCHQEWAQRAYLSTASPLNIVQKQGLLWFSYNFYKRNSHYITPEKFFYKGGITWEDQIFKFWWDYI